MKRTNGDESENRIGFRRKTRNRENAQKEEILSCKKVVSKSAPSAKRSESYGYNRMKMFQGSSPLS